MSTFNITPFSSVQNSFDSQVSTFAHMAGTGLTAPSLLPTSNGIPNSIASDVASVIPAGLPSLGSMAGSAANAAGSAVLSSIFSSRVVAVVLGLILIAGAIFLFGADELFSSPIVKRVSNLTEA